MDAPPVRYVTTSDGYSIAFAVQGSGSPLVLLPFPGPHSLTWWYTVDEYRRLHQRLVARFQVIAYDSRGEGLSERGLREGHRAEDWQHDLEAVVESLGLTRLVLYGQAAASHVAIRYAVKNPGRVDGLVLWNAGTTGPAQLGWTSYMYDMAAENWEFFLETLAQNRFPEMDRSERMEHLRRAVTQADWLTRTRALDQDSIEPLLSQVQVPALLLAGGSPPGVARWEGRNPYVDLAKHMAGVIPNARLALLEDQTTIAAPGEQVGQAERAIDGFLREIEAGGPAPPDRSHRDTAITSPAGQSGSLSGRQIEVLELIAEGKTTREIAAALVLSERTVERHISDIYARIGARNRAEATAYALSRFLT